MENIQKEISNLVQTILVDLKNKNLTGYEISANLNSGLSTNVRLGKVETIEFNKDKSINITVYNGQKKGHVSITDFTKTTLRNAIDTACRIATYTEEDPYSGLIDTEYLAKDILDLDLYHPSSLTPDQAIETAIICEQAGLDYSEKIINSEGASCNINESFRVYANSNNFFGKVNSTSHSISCVLVGKQGDNLERDYDFSVARDYNDLIDQKKIGQNAAVKTIQRLGSRKIKTCQAPVIFIKDVATGLLGSFLSAISGAALYKKSSFLLDCLGKQVFPNFIDIKEKPHILKGIGSAPYDLEGMQTRNNDLVKSGILTTYLLNSYSARKLHMKPTGHAGGVRNLEISSQYKFSDNDLIKKMNKGLIITELMGHGTNIVTGDYSRGAVGFWVENGEILYPVHEITVAGNLKDMFANIVAISNELDVRSNIRTGSILLDQMTIAGN